MPFLGQRMLSVGAIGALRREHGSPAWPRHDVARCTTADPRWGDWARFEVSSPIKAPTVEMLLLRSLGPGSCSNESIVNIHGIHQNLVLRKIFLFYVKVCPKPVRLDI